MVARAQRTTIAPPSVATNSAELARSNIRPLEPERSTQSTNEVTDTLGGTFGGGDSMHEGVGA